MAENDWKIMVYLSGDNDLGESMVSSITGLARLIGKTDRATVHVFYDSSVADYPSLVFHFTNAGDGEVIDLGYEVNASERSVYKFLESCFVDRPAAEKHMLVLSGHGDAFQGNNFLRDSGGDSSVSMTGLSRVLRDIKKKYLKDRNFDIIGFDSCCMSGVEIAMQIDQYADKMIASQGLTPHDGWDYAGLIDRMLRSYRTNSSSGSISVDAMCNFVTRSFMSYYEDRTKYSGRSVDITVCDLNTFAGIDAKTGERTSAGIVRSLNDVAKDLNAAFEAKLWGRQLGNALLAAHHNSQTFLFDQCVDIADLATELRNEIAELAGNDRAREALVASCTALIERVESTCNVKIDGSEYQWSGGLSVYFPWSYISYYLVRRTYLKFDFANKKRLPLRFKPSTRSHIVDRPAESDWVRLLDRFLESSIKPENQRLFTAERSKSFESLSIPIAHFVAGNGTNRVNDPRDRVNDPYDRVNDPRDKLTMHRWENFRRMKNFPWRPLSYLPETRMAARRTN